MLAEEIAIERSFGADAWTVKVVERPELLEIVGISKEELDQLIEITQSDVINYLQSFALAS